MQKFTIPPESESYSVKDGLSFVSVALEGGLSRRRADVINAASKARVRWSFDRAEYDYFRAFFDTATMKGSLPFTLDLVVDKHYRQEYICAFVEDTLELSELSGHSYRVSAELEVIPKRPDHVGNQTLIDSYATTPAVGFPLGVLIQTEDDDTLTSAGTATVGGGPQGSLSVNEEDDSFVSDGIVQVSEKIASLSITEEDATVTSAGTSAGATGNEGVLNVTEDDDSLTATGTAII
jgi:hypothetical protein